MQPYFADEQVTLYAGDCLDVLADLADNSIDAVVTDPPYGLEFMGKEWDSFKFGPTGGASFTEDGMGKGFRSPPSFTGSPNPTCLNCKGSQRGQAFPDIRGKQMRTYQAWCQQWAAECLRVLKPGGHMLAFGGTRTWHRLAAAIEDAGFEIRDSIAWLYGSGFPKSLDVSKAIDRARDDNSQRKAVGAWLRSQREARGLTQKTVAAHWPSATGGLTGCVANWELGFNLPTWDQWLQLKALLSLPDDMDAEVWRLNGRKGKPSDAWDQRETLGKSAHKSGIANATKGHYTVGGTIAEAYNVTAPATDAAKQWQGWGTALKPSWESIVVAVKPPLLAGILDSIGSHLDRLESECKPPANAAAPSSAPTRQDSHAVRIGSAPASAAILPAAEQAPITETGAAADLSAATDTSASESTATTYSNTVTSWRQCWVELCDATSTYTTATNVNLTTDLKTLNSCLSQITPATTIEDRTQPNGSNFLATAADNLFGACVLSSRATRALSVTEIATSETPTDYPAGAANQLEPIVVARKPLAGTVVNNVLEHGTGALNISACRVTASVQNPEPSTSQDDAHSSRADSTVCTCLSHEDSQTGHTVSSLCPAWSDASRADHNGPQPSGPEHELSCPQSPDSLDGYLTSPCSCDERVHSTTVVDPTSVQQRHDAQRSHGRCATTEHNQNACQSTACSDYTGGNVERHTAGRWPTNAALDGDMADELDKQSGAVKAGGSKDSRGSQNWAGTGDSRESIRSDTFSSYADVGGASRFFPTFRYTAKAPTSERPTADGIAHPTVKPLDLMRWLVRLVTPPNGLVLDPFAGTGTTAEACIHEHKRAIVIEREASYLPLIKARLHKPMQVGFDFEEPA